MIIWLVISFRSLLITDVLVCYNQQICLSNLSCCHLWNELPSSITSAPSLSVVRQLLLYSVAYWDICFIANLTLYWRGSRNYHHHHHFWQAPLRVSSAECRHQSPELTVLSQVNCVVHIEVAGFQILLNVFHPCNTRTSQWSPPVSCGGSC